MGLMMLIKFEVENFKNFNEKFVFDLSNVKNYEFNGSCINNGLVNKALIYGPNGSGKSNLGFAIFDIVSHLTDNHDHKNFYRNFLNAENSLDTIAKFSYHIRIKNNDIIYEYAKKTHEKLVYEKLFINGKLVISYNRESDLNATVLLAGAENLNTDLKETSLSIVKYVKSNTVLDENAENDTFLAFFDFINGMLYFKSLEGQWHSYIGQEITQNRVSEGILEEDLLDDFEKFLNDAGVKCKLSKMNRDGEDLIAFSYGKRKIEYSQAASTGTMSLGHFFYWLHKLKKNLVSFLFMDEFDAYYHHNLSKLIVNEIKQSSSQSILTTHNTSIMTNDLLRPDCYFILDNNKINPIFKFTDKELRKAHNIEKMYKAGAFNA
jgi:hypothetical protein